MNRFLAPLVVTALALPACDVFMTVENRPPVANAGPDQSVTVGEKVFLDGSGSYDPDGDTLAYQWDLVAVPEGATAALGAPADPSTDLEPDVVGPWVVRLVVSDGSLSSEPDVVQVRVVGQPCEQDWECDDGIWCNGDEYCSNNLCRSSSRDCSFVADSCNDPGCDEWTDQCRPVPLADGTECEDGFYCSVSDHCTGGVCGGSQRDCSEAAEECEAGVCDEASRKCVGQPIAGDLCDDGEYCTVNERCTGGQCGGGQPRDCTAAGGGCVDGVCDEETDRCVGDPLIEGTPCNDGQFCTVADACDGSGICEGEQRDCSGLSNQCNQGSCDEGLDQCVALPANQGSDCNDGLYCTRGETCQSGNCTGGQGVDCDDSDPCTIDTCDEANDTCENLLVPNPNTEGVWVTGTCGDEVDNDCDRLVDGADPDCQECQNDSDCEDSNPCTINTCQDNHCSTALVDDGTGCDDGLYCSYPDTCTGGICSGPNQDCSGQSDQCNQGVCNESAGRCESQPIREGQACDDGLYCNVDETCQSGVCTGGQGRDCNHLADDCNDGYCDEGAGQCRKQPARQGEACNDGVFCTDPDTCSNGECSGPPRDCSGFGDQCNDGVCSEASGACTQQPKGAGVSCDDGVYCNGSDECDGTGGCSVHSGDPCQAGQTCNESGDVCEDLGCATDSDCPPGDLCRPECFGGVTGCGTPPTGMILECLPNPVDLTVTDTSSCTIDLGLAGQESCLSCTSEVGLVIVDRTDFEGCTQNGWTLVSANVCSDAVENCTLAGSQAKTCCDQFVTLCETVEGNTSLRADEAQNCGGGHEQWRLEKTCDFSGLANIQICLDIADVNADPKQGVLVYAYDGSNGPDQILCFNNGPRQGVDGVFYRYCSGTLNAWADDNPGVTIRIIAHSENNGRMMFIDNVTVKGWVQWCPPAYATVFTEDFSGCPDPLFSGWNGWTVNGAVRCVAGFDCYDASSRAETDTTAGIFERYVDASTLDGDVRLCFYYGDDGLGTDKTLSVEFDPGTGWREAFTQVGDPGPDMSCSEICINLSELDPAVNRNPSLGISFDMATGGDKIVVDHITLSGAQYCDGSGAVLLGPIVDDGDGTYTFTARDAQASQLTSDILCWWDTPPPEQKVEDMESVRYRP